MDQFISFGKVFCLTVAAACVNFLLPIGAFVGIAFAMVLGDLIAGVMAAGKRGDKITPSGLTRSVVKFLLYALAIIASRGMENVFFQGFPLTYTVAGYICLIEFWSLLGHVGAVTGADIVGMLKGRLPDITAKTTKKK